jgi:ubiquinone/menaquinone biosynthesis C-methylase UbiE
MSIFSGTRITLSETQFIDVKLASFFDGHARRFMGPVYRRFAAKASRLNPPGGRTLDIGTGSGYLAIELAKARPEQQVTGIDVSEEMLKLAAGNAARSGLTGRIEFRQAQAAALPFPDGCFDLVTSNASLHLWKDPVKVFREIARVTAPGGYCLIWDNFRLRTLNPFLSLLGGVMGMNAAQRRLWMQAINSSYTAGEVKAILRESSLKGARIFHVPAVLCLGIAWKKPG